MNFGGDYFQLARQVADIQDQITLPDLGTDDPAIGTEAAHEWVRLAHALHELAAGYAHMGAEIYKSSVHRLGCKLRDAVGKGYLGESDARVSPAQMEDIAVSLVTCQWEVAAAIVLDESKEQWPPNLRDLANGIVDMEVFRDDARNLTVELRRPRVAS